MASTNRFFGRCHNILIEMVATHLGAHSLFFSPTQVNAYSIMGECDEALATEVTAMDFLSLLMNEEMTQLQAHAALRNALHQITREPNETIAAIASRLIDTVRASIVDRDRPHATEMIFSRRYIPRNKLANLVQRFSVIFTPEVSERVDQRAIVTTHTNHIAEVLQSIPVVPRDPWAPTCARDVGPPKWLSRHRWMS